jgi:4-hydroxythreonine-4-phosphate dehydrogenase
MTKFNKKIAITTGDVNGIGAEITIKALNQLDLPKENVVIISNSDVLNFYGRLKTDYEVVEIKYDKSDIEPGKITANSGNFGFKTLKMACDMAKNGQIDAIVTAPLSKIGMQQAGHIYSGQTEVLQKFLAKDAQRAEMLFVAKDFRVLLLTRHVPLKEIFLTKDSVVELVVNLNEFFKSKFKIAHPKFALCAFNPHAGEGGILGREEIEILSPAVAELKGLGVDITEPLPADTLFIQASKAYLNNQKNPYDCYLANYHDQGLIPIKSIASDKTVNMTIGLDVIRTSPSHGTAFDIAGKNLASAESMVEAILQSLQV